MAHNKKNMCLNEEREVFNQREYSEKNNRKIYLILLVVSRNHSQRN